jgi:hypothetical protein
MKYFATILAILSSLLSASLFSAERSPEKMHQDSPVQPRLVVFEGFFRST